MLVFRYDMKVNIVIQYYQIMAVTPHAIIYHCCLSILY